MTWQPLARGYNVVDGKRVDKIDDEEVWLNDEYVVYLRRMTSDIEDQPEAIHLSIKSQDRSIRHDWRDFQRIKNQLCGPEWEAMEIYPAESRLVDGANQYHLWCFPFNLGIGFNRRLVMDQETSEKAFPMAKGAVQRPFEEVDLQYGGLSTIEEAHEASDNKYYADMLGADEAPGGQQ